MRYLITFLLLATTGFAATIAAASASLADVQTAVNSASNDDTVTIPAGTPTWTGTLTITTAITLQGAGIGQTVIQDNVSTGSGKLMNWTLVANKTSRMTGIEIADGGRPSNQTYVVEFNGALTDSRRLRVDNCKFGGYASSNSLRSLQINNCLGVIDNCTIAREGTPIYVFMDAWGGYSNAAGSWADAPGFGTENFLFIENNTFTASTGMAAFDCWNGARIVFRNNTCTKALLEVHGTDSGGILRGGRAFEIYGNTFTGQADGSAYVVNGRSGTFRIYNNTVNSLPGAVFQLAYYRAAFPYGPWTDADGDSAWDVNHASNPFYEGTASSGGTLTVTVTGAGWTPDNKWKGYTINKTSGAADPGYGYITSSTSDTITYIAPARGELGNLAFVNGNTFEINKITHAFDAPSRGQGTRLAAADPPEAPVGWPPNDQVTEPSYAWNNALGNESPVFSSSPYDDLIRVNEHYFNSEPEGYTAYTYPHPLRGAATYTPGRLRMLRR